MPNSQHIITYNAENFDDLVALVECFVSGLGVGTLQSFEAQRSSNGKWTAIVNYRGDFKEPIACRIPVGFLGRIECVYEAELQVPSALSTDYRCWINGEEVTPSTVVLLTATETLRITFASLPFSAGDLVELSFCNTQGMNVNNRLCTSFVRLNVINNLI